MRRAIAAQPEWIAAVPGRVGDRRVPDGAVVIGCGTSYHAAQTAPRAVQALEAVLCPPKAEALVCVSHEGETELVLEAARAFDGPVWLMTGKEESPLVEIADEVVVVTPEVEKSWCHTASYTCAVAGLAALRGADVSGVSALVEEAIAAPPEPVSTHSRWLIAGAGRDWPTAQEAVLKLREGAWVAAEAHHTEQLLHGHLAAVDETVRCFVLQGEGRAADRAGQAALALGRLGCEVALVPTVHPVADIVRFQRLTLDLADDRGIDPDWIHRDDERWKNAAAAHKG